MIDREINLFDVFKSLWKAKIYTTCSVILCLIFALIFLLLVKPTYKATMIVAPADGYALGDYASSVQYDRVAALPFWRPKDQEGASTDFYRFMHTLRGTAVSSILLKDEVILSRLNKEVSEPIQKPESLSAYLSKKVRIDPLGATPLRRISYRRRLPRSGASRSDGRKERRHG